MVSETKRTDLDRRQLAPALGLREFWYPAILDKKVGKKPIQLQMLGEELCFFRIEQGEVSALSDICPHRGAT